MTHPDSPDEFELALQRRAQLLPQFDADIDGPDASVDRIVLARARGSFAPARDVEPRYHRAPRWALPVALAATLLLSFTLVLQMSGRNPAPQPPRVASDATAVALDAVPEAAAPAGAATDTVASAAAAPEVVAPPASVAKAAGPAVEQPTEARASAAAVLAAPSMEMRAAASPPPAAAPPPTAAAPPPPVAARSVAPAITAQTAMRGELADANADAARLAEREESPAAWLRRIESLRAAGDLEAARRELAEFRRQYPDVPLPEPLRGL